MREKKAPPDHQAFFTPGQAADWTGLSIRTIYKYCEKGASPQLPHTYGPGGKILIIRDALSGWLALFQARPRRPKRGSS